MMDRQWKNILARYGRQVTLHRAQGDVPVRAFVQPVPERRRDQEVPDPLGYARQDSLVYLGPGEHPVDLDTTVECGGRDYRVRSAHRMGEGVCPYWWAWLYPREEAAV